jgi:hypothetical protein
LTNFSLRLALGAALLAGCAKTGPGPEQRVDWSAKKLPAKALQPFQEFPSLDVKIQGDPGMWGSLDPAILENPGPMIRAALILADIRRPARRAALFEAEFPRGEFQPEKIDDALAYLFKVDPADSAAPPPVINFVICRSIVSNMSKRATRPSSRRMSPRPCSELRICVASLPTNSIS